jgi:hypothetical protein
MLNELISQPTYRLSQVELSSAAISTNYSSKSDLQHNTKTTTTQLEMQQKKTNEKFENTLLIHHPYENCFRQVKRDLHEVHKDIFSQSAAINIKMIVGNRNRRNAAHDLIRKRPKQSLLKNKEHKSE